MAFPLIPIAVVALIAMAAGGTKKKRRAPAPPPTPDEGYEGEIYAFALEDFEGDAPLPIDVLPGDMIRFDLQQPVPYEWQMFSEATEGSPVLEVHEEQVPGGGEPGAPNRYLADLVVHPGAGTVVLDFMLMGPDNQPADTKQAIIRVV